MIFFRTRDGLMTTGVFICALALAIAIHMTSSSATAKSTRADAAAVYKSKCASCHGADGKGDTPAGKKMGAKDFREFQGDMYPIIANGKGKMPAYEKSLGAETCKALADYIKATFK